MSDTSGRDNQDVPADGEAGPNPDSVQPENGVEAVREGNANGDRDAGDAGLAPDEETATLANEGETAEGEPRKVKEAEEEPGKGKEAADSSTRVAAVRVGAVLLVFASLAFLIVRFFWLGGGELDVVAAVQPAEARAHSDDAGAPPGDPGAGKKSVAPGLVVFGRVLHKGDPVEGALVWAIARDHMGNRFTPKSVTTNAVGEFVLEPIAALAGWAQASADVTEVMVHALSKQRSLWVFNDDKRGEAIITHGQGAPRRLTRPMTGAMMIVLLLFVLSLLVAFWPGKEPWQWKLKYYASLGLAVLFLIGVLGGIGYFQIQVSRVVRSGEALTLGFANIFVGTYVEDQDSQTLIALTAAPTPKKAESQPSTASESETLVGFGAPLWVILLSVVGSGLLSVILIVGEIGKPPKFTEDDRGNLRAKIQNIVQHQFFTLFAPLGGIFLYQALVVGEAASHPVTVGIAALGAGATVNALMSQAVPASQRWLELAVTPPAKEKPSTSSRPQEEKSVLPEVSATPVQPQ